MLERGCHIKNGKTLISVPPESRIRTNWYKLQGNRLYPRIIEKFPTDLSRLPLKVGALLHSLGVLKQRLGCQVTGVLWLDLALDRELNQITSSVPCNSVVYFKIALQQGKHQYTSTVYEDGFRCPLFHIIP